LFVIFAEIVYIHPLIPDTALVSSTKLPYSTMMIHLYEYSPAPAWCQVQTLQVLSSSHCSAQSCQDTIPDSTVDPVLVLVLVDSRGHTHCLVPDTLLLSTTLPTRSDIRTHLYEYSPAPPWCQVQYLQVGLVRVEHFKEQADQDWIPSTTVAPLRPWVLVFLSGHLKLGIGGYVTGPGVVAEGGLPYSD